MVSVLQHLPPVPQQLLVVAQEENPKMRAAAVEARARERIIFISLILGGIG